MDDTPANSQFGLRASVKLAITLVIAYVFLTFTLTALIDLTASSALWPSNLSKIDRQIALRIASSVLGPILMAWVTLLLLKEFLPTERYGSLLVNFGFGQLGKKHTLFFSFFLGLSVVLLIKYLRSMHPPVTSVPIDTSLTSFEVPLWAQLVLSINVFTLVPIVEEFVFRGVLYKGLLVACNKVVAATAVSVLFSLAHFDALSSGYWVSQTAAILFPLILITARELTGSLYSPILIHSGFNFGTVFIVYE